MRAIDVVSIERGISGPQVQPEARNAQARALEEKGKEYIVPIRIDDTELEGLLRTVGYVPISTGIEKIGEVLVKKFHS